MFAAGEAATWCQCRGLKYHWTSAPSSCPLDILQRERLKQNNVSVLSPKRFYLIGGGIPIIVCGITAAANIKNYGSRTNAP